MITINAEDFANLQPEERRQYGAAANSFRLAEVATDLFKKREFLVEGKGHLKEVGDTERINLVDAEIATISKAITVSLVDQNLDNLQ